VDAAKLYEKDFGKVYKMFDELENKYMKAEVINPKTNKPIKLDTLLRRQAYDLTGKKGYLLRRFMEIDHGDILNDPFGDLRLMDRTTNVTASNIKRQPKYQNNPELLAKKLDEIGYNRKFNNTDELIEFYSKKASPKSFAETIRPKGSGGVFEDALKSKAFKKGWRGFRKVGGPWELGFIGADFINNLDSMNADTAFQTALSNATLGMYEGGKRAQWKDFETAGKELGHNPENLGEIKSIMDLEKMLEQEKTYLESMKLFGNEEEVKHRQQVITRLEKEFENKQNTFWSKDNAQDLVGNYHDTVGYVARKEYNKNLKREGAGKMFFGDKERRVNPDMNVIGSPLWQVITDWKDYVPQSILPQNFLQNYLTKAIPNTLRKLPGVLGEMWEPTSERAKLYDMSDEEIKQRAKDLNIQEQYYHPVTGNTMTEGQMEPYYEKFYSGGGIASLNVKK